ncbi:hypothetical protein TYRP_001944, partial [Tyrophagus putrescentiae]
ILKMADQDIKQTVLKLEALKTSICELFAKDNSDYFAVIEKLEQMEHLVADLPNLSTTSKEEDETIKKTKDDLACLSSIAGPSDVEAIKKLHLFTEKVRNGEPSAMYTQQSASIFAAAFEKLSLDQKEFYSQLNYTKDATKNNYRCWSN